MEFFGNGLVEAWQLLTGGDPAIWGITWVTLQVAAVSTAVALVLGLPLGLRFGLGGFRGQRVALAVANAGLGLPPVVIGLILALLFFPAAPLGGLKLLFTLNGVFVAQTLLALPVIVALSAAAIRGISPGLLDQARAFGASGTQVALLALREARIGILASIIAAVGSALSEVGAVVLVGGNIEGLDQTLASAALSKVDAGHFSEGLAIGILLLLLIGIIAGALTLLQYWDGRSREGRS